MTTRHLSPLRKVQRQVLETAASCGTIYGGQQGDYPLTFCRALVNKGYLSGSLTDKGRVPFTITEAGRDALCPPADEYLPLLPTGPSPDIASPVVIKLHDVWYSSHYITEYWVECICCGAGCSSDIETIRHSNLWNGQPCPIGQIKQLISNE
jgi:hypothetical protein